MLKRMIITLGMDIRNVGFLVVGPVTSLLACLQFQVEP